jgi:hypothetical protein
MLYEIYLRGYMGTVVQYMIRPFKTYKSRCDEVHGAQKLGVFYTVPSHNPLRLCNTFIRKINVILVMPHFLI